MQGGTSGVSTRVSAYDGLRGLAVAAVVCFHARVPGMRGGFLGVSAFFTLSGYLITSLLLDERSRTGRISLRAFWGRRARRLLPAAYVALAAIVLFGSTIATADQARALRGDVLSALTYVANWRFYFAGQSYSQLFSAPSPVLHFWSLAIEEQFYLLFPLAVAGVMALGRGRRSVLAIVLLAGTAASIVAGFAFSDTNSRVYYGTDTRAAELLIGALLAVALHGRASRAPAGRRAGLVTTLAGVAALAALLALWTTVHQSDTWLAHGGFALHACLTAVLIAALRRPGPLASTLSWKPLVALGAISYGVYLFHWPLFLWLTPARTGMSGVPLFGIRVGLAVLVATVSYRYLEQPIRTRGKIRGASPRVLAPVAVAALVAGCVAVTSSAPQPVVILHAIGSSSPDTHLAAVRETVNRAASASASRRSGTHHANTSTTPRPQSAPAAADIPKRVVMHRAVAPDRPLRVMVVGDSVGITFGRGVELWALDHNAKVLNVARKWCSLGRNLGRVLPTGVKPAGTCADWDTRWPRLIDSFDPDVVFVMYTVWEGMPRQFPGDSEYLSPGNPRLDAWQLGEYEAATDLLSRRGAHVVWFTIPCDQRGALAPPEPMWYVNRRTLPKLAAARTAASIIDLDHELCGGTRATTPKAYAGIADARPDARHFSDAGALAVANWVMPIVNGAAAPPPVPTEH